MRKARNARSSVVVRNKVGKCSMLSRNALLPAATACVVLGVGLRPLQAANQAWSISPPTNTFSGNDWTTGSTTPGAATGTISSGDSLYFGNSGTTSLNNDEAADFAPGGITFNSGAKGFSISGNELDLSSSPITDNAAALETINTSILLNSVSTFTIANGSNLAFTSPFIGGGGFTTAGTGTLSLSGQYVYNPANPFGTPNTGTNTIGSGRVIELNTGGALGSGSTNTIASGATLELRDTLTANLSQFTTTFNGAGTLQKTGYGNFIFGGAGSGGTGNVTVSLGSGGLINIQSGQLIGSSSGQGQWAGDQATMNIAAGASFEGDEAPVFIDALTGSGTYLGGYGGATTTTIGVANSSGTFSGQLEDSRDGGGILSLTKAGTGTEILTGANTFSGYTTVTGGTLQLNNNLALQESVVNIPAAGTGSILFGPAFTTLSMQFGGIAGTTNFALQNGGNPTSLTLTGSGGANSIFTGALVGGTTLTKAGGGIQTLSGANTFTGGTTILEGGLSLDYNANASGGKPIIPSTSSLTMGGTSGFVKNTLAQSYPILQVQGSSTGPVTQTFAGLKLNPGSSQIAARGLNGNTATLALGAMSHTAGAAVVFSNLNDGITGSSGVITTSATPDASGVLGGWAGITASPVNSASIQLPTAFATVAGGVLVPYTGYTTAQSITDATTPVPTSFAGGTNQNFVFTPTTASPSSGFELGTPDGVTTDVNTILVSPSSTNRLKLDIGSTTTPSTGILRFGVDGGLMTAATGSNNSRTSIGFSTADGGFLTAGGPTSNTAGTITFQLNNRIDIYAKIIDNGTGPVTVVYNLYQNFTSYINNSNTYSGGTFINSGRIQPSQPGAFGTGPVSIGPMGQLYFQANFSYANAFNINGDAGNPGFFFDTPSAIRFNSNDSLTGNVTLLGDSTIEGGSGTNTISGQISGNYNLQFNQNVNGAGPGNVTLTNSNNNWGGATTLRGGSLTLAAAGALPSGTDLSIFNGGNLVDSALPVGKALSVGQLNFFGQMGVLDLNNNDLIVHSSTLAAVNGLVQLGYNNGLFNGSAGIISSAAAANTSHLTALGVITNDNGSGTPLYGSGGAIAATFGGAVPVDGDVLVKYTYYGDANLDGKVDGSDYSRIDNGFLSKATGWANGDFNYDGVINGSDYTLIDNAFNTQGALVASSLASPTAEISPPGSLSAVPEPATLGLFGIGVVGLLSRRRHL